MFHVSQRRLSLSSPSPPSKMPMMCHHRPASQTEALFSFLTERILWNTIKEGHVASRPRGVHAFVFGNFTVQNLRLNSVREVSFSENSLRGGQQTGDCLVTPAICHPREADLVTWNPEPLLCASNICIPISIVSVFLHNIYWTLNLSSDALLPPQPLLTLGQFLQPPDTHHQETACPFLLCTNSTETRLGAS